MRRVLVLLLVVVALPLFAAHREVQNVEVVQVPVYVSTATGVVTGLTRDNFELFVNGKPRPFDYFDAIDFAAIAPPAPPGVPADPRQRRLYVLLFDLFYASPNSIHRAQKAAQARIAQAGYADVFAVATYRANRGIDVLVPFTKDRAAVARAVSSLRASSSADPLRLAVGDAEMMPIQTAFDRGEIPASTQTMRVAEQMIADRARLGAQDQMEALAVLAAKLAPIDGQKHVVLLSSGPPRGFAGNGQARMSLRRMRRKFADAGVFLDAIDIAGLRHTWVVDANESLHILTRATAGTVVDHRNDLAQALQLLADRQRVVYVLGFHHRDTGRRENEIAVRLRGVEGHPTVSYRTSYSPAAPPPSSENGLQLADILLNDIPQNGVTVDASAKGTTVSVSIPARELLVQIDSKTARADAMIYVFSGARVVATKVKRIDIEKERAAAAPAGAAIHFDESFDLPPGNYTAKVLVRLGESMGFARTDFKAEK